MNIKRIVVGPYSVNCYIVYEDNKGFIVDPGGDFDDINKFIVENKIELEFIILTHGHGDHIGAVQKVKTEFNIPIYASIEEKELLSNSVMNLSSSIPPFKPIELSADLYIKDGDEIKFNNKKIKFLLTPGHTVGSLCFYIDSYFFTGDTLFKMSIGRSDLATGSYDDIINSLKKIKSLEDNMTILPGHGAESTLDYEKKNNPFLKNI